MTIPHARSAAVRFPWEDGNMTNIGPVLGSTSNTAAKLSITAAGTGFVMG